MHTARHSVENCFIGDLAKGRTIILVTHNVSLTSPIADYMVVLDSNGTVKSHGPVQKILNEESSPRLDATRVLEVAEKKEKNADMEEEDQARRQGKQVVSEEVPVGHIGWPVCEHLFIRWTKNVTF